MYKTFIKRVLKTSTLNACIVAEYMDSNDEPTTTSRWFCLDDLSFPIKDKKDFLIQLKKVFWRK